MPAIIHYDEDADLGLLQGRATPIAKINQRIQQFQEALRLIGAWRVVDVDQAVHRRRQAGGGEAAEFRLVFVDRVALDQIFPLRAVRQLRY